MARAPLSQDELVDVLRLRGEGRTWDSLARDYQYHSEKNIRRAVRRAQSGAVRLAQQEVGPPTEPKSEPDAFDAPEAESFIALMSKFKDYLAEENRDEYGVDEVHKTIDTKLPIGFVEICDMHLGDGGVDYDLVLEDVQTWATEPGLFLLDGGDTVNNVLKSSPGGHYSQMMRPKTQWRALDLFYAMLKDRLVSVVASNHPWRTEAAADVDKVAEICQKNGIPYLPNGGLVHLTVGEQTYDIATWHLFAGESKINKGNAFRRLFDEANQPDVVLLADAHDAYAEVSWRGSKRSVRLRGGTYKTKDGFLRRYCGRTSDPPTTMPMAIFFPDRHHILAFDDFRDGLIMLRALRA